MNKRKIWKQLGLAAIVSVIASAMVVSVAGAQSPPTPPSRFVGSVTVNGAPAAAGTTIEARIGATTCGVTTVFMSGGQARYALDSPALDPAQNPACGTDGAVVTFFVGGQQANETGSWANYQLNTVNLTVTPATTPTTPAGTPTSAATPRPPVAGNGGAEAGSSAPLTEVLLLATAIGLAGVGLAARARKS
jgi:hypothetical protein